MNGVSLADWSFLLFSEHPCPSPGMNGDADIAPLEAQALLHSEWGITELLYARPKFAFSPYSSLESRKSIFLHILSPV